MAFQPFAIESQPQAPVNSADSATPTERVAMEAAQDALDRPDDAGVESGDDGAAIEKSTPQSREPDGDAGDEAQTKERPTWARPDDEEAAKAWREEHGVPQEADGYDLPIDPDSLDHEARLTVE